MAIVWRLGMDNRKKAMHKAAHGVCWTYCDGRISHNKDGVGFTLSSCDTLALTNLLWSHYEEIVAYARDEQRISEYEKDARRMRHLKE